MQHKSGFISIVGRPNVGKSTLLNQIIGQKIAIMTDKPQTTRNTIRAIFSDDNAQMIFLDTPGIHKPKHALGDYMVNAAKRSLNEVEVILFMVDDSLNIGPGDTYILDLLSEIKTPIILVINKRDLIEPDAFKNIYDAYKQYPFITDIVGISALSGGGIDDLLKKVRSFLPIGPKYFDDDAFTDQPERQIVSEIIREKLLMFLSEEVPHGVAVVIDSFKERTQKQIVDIEATIICERKSHKGIIIGKAGKKIKGVGMAARKDIEQLLATKVNLQLFVKVREGWRDDKLKLKNYGYDLNE